MNEHILMNAVRELRDRLGLTQQQYAARIGKSYPSIQRYEQVRPPREMALWPFILLAEKSGYVDLAAIFREAAPESPDADRGTKETCPSAPVSTGHYQFSRANAEWHEKLETVLNDGTERDKVGIQANLDWAVDTIKSRRPPSRRKAG